jgi:hypothetical protein
MQQAGSVRDPRILPAIRSVVESRATAQDGVPVDAVQADAIDSYLLPALLRLVEAADGSASEINQALFSLEHAKLRIRGL